MVGLWMIQVTHAPRGPSARGLTANWEFGMNRREMLRKKVKEQREKKDGWVQWLPQK